MASHSATAASGHIILPFDLRVDLDAFHEPENLDLLMNLFPRTHGISMDGFFIYFLRKDMPPKPWPKSVAGLPPYFAPSMGPQYIPMPLGWRVGMRNGAIGEGLDGSDMVDWEPLFIIVRNHFREIGMQRL